MKLKELIGNREERFQVDEDFTHGRSEGYFFDQRRLANICGTAAFLLPVVILVVSLSTDSLRHSISHYYYAPFLGDVFVGILCIIGALLIAYRGTNREENWITIFAGLCAIAVALIPTVGAGHDVGKFGARVMADADLAAGADGALTTAITKMACQPDFFCFFQVLSWFHAISAAVLFCTLAFLNLVVFTRVDAPSNTKRGTLKKSKKNRNFIYLICGWTTLVALSALVGSFALGVMETRWWNDNRLTFWGETIMVLAFAISWVTKGQLLSPVRDEPNSGS